MTQTRPLRRQRRQDGVSSGDPDGVVPSGGGPPQPTGGTGAGQGAGQGNGQGDGQGGGPGSGQEAGQGAGQGAGQSGSQGGGASQTSGQPGGGGNPGATGTASMTTLGGVPGSGGGTVTGTLPGATANANTRLALPGAAIAAIVLAILLVLSIALFLVRLFYRRRREARRHNLSHLPPLYSDTNLPAAERLRGGLVDPFSGAASVDTLPSVYRIEPFRPDRPPMHRRQSSSTRLLPPGAMAVERTRDPEKSARPTRAAPAGSALGLDLGRRYERLGSEAVGSPTSEDDIIEFPPTYASLNPVRNRAPPQRPWYRFW